jgi:hypothetical protein
MKKLDKDELKLLVLLLERYHAGEHGQPEQVAGSVESRDVIGATAHVRWTLDHHDERRIEYLTELLRQTQWVQPMSNSGASCSGCGRMRHQGCAADCDVARATGDRGTR